MNMATAFRLVKDNYWKATSVALNRISLGACVIVDMNGVLCLFDGKKSIPIETSRRLRPDVWEQAEKEGWGICL